MENKIYSFDIFDTCLVRTCGFPHNVFDILALEILGENSSNSLRADFVNTRISAEEIAREKKQAEVTLKEIYQECNFEGFTSTNKDTILNREIEVERKVLVGVSSIREQIKKIHQQGANVFFISDMYLPETFIKEVLIKEGFWEENDKLYVSCASGKTKHDGTLFDLVAKENHIPFKKWQHWGDNKRSDYIVPKQKGIKARLVKHKFSRYERKLLEQTIYPEIFINQQMAGIQKAIRLSLGSTPQVDLTSNIVIPLLTTFVFQIIEDAQKENIKKIFFLARDGYLPYYITKLLQTQYPDIQVEYFYTSRSALYFPGLNSPDINSLKDMFGKFTGKNLVEMFIDRTNIDITSFISNEKNTILTSEDQGCKILEQLYNNPLFVEKINKEYKRQRKLVEKYFIQTGLASNEKAAIVDIRGTRKCHMIINNILQAMGYPKVKGYYMEVTKDRMSIEKAGNYFSVFFSERYKLANKPFKYLGDLYAVIEQYFCSTGSQRTIQYEEKNNKIIPVYEDGSSYEYGKKICNLHEIIADRYVQYLIDNHLISCNKEVTPLVYGSLYSFATVPYVNDLAALKNIRVNDDKFHYLPLINKHPLTHLLKRKYNKNEWSNGSKAYTLYSIIGEKFGRIILSKLQK